MNRELLDQVMQHDSVPTIPAFALKVIELCGREDVSVREVSNLVQFDAAISAKLLRLANSALFGRSREVSTVPEAVSMLGLGTVRMISVATALVGGLEKTVAPGFDRSLFWRGALIASMAARRLAEKVRGVPLDRAFIGGLLQDLGVCLLHRTLGERYHEVLANSRSRPTALAAAELDAFGLTHAEVGAELLRSWDFPEVLVEGILGHEDEDLPADPRPGLAAVLRVADSHRAAFLSPTAAEVAELNLRSKHWLGVSEDATSEVFAFVQRYATQTAALLEIDIGNAGVIDTARVEATKLLVSALLEAQHAPRDGDGDAPARGVTLYRIEIDSLDAIAGRLGQEVAARVVESVSDQIREVLRKSDLLLSWHDHGLLVVTPLCSENNLRQPAERFLNVVHNHPVHTSEGPVAVTLSVGAASAVCEEESHRAELLERVESLVSRACSGGGGLAVDETMPLVPGGSCG